jgi:hypothetical protein
MSYCQAVTVRCLCGGSVNIRTGDCRKCFSHNIAHNIGRYIDEDEASMSLQVLEIDKVHKEARK